MLAVGQVLRWLASSTSSLEASHQGKQSALLTLPCCEEAHIGHSKGDNCPAPPRWSCDPSWGDHHESEAATSPYGHHGQQENHPAEPCSDAESWEIITGYSKPLSFGAVCYIATDNWNIFTYAFLPNHCSPEKGKDSPRFFSVHLSLAPADFSRLSLETSAKLVFLLFLNMSVPDTPISMILLTTNPVWRLDWFPLFNRTTTLWEFSTLEGQIEEWHSLLSDLCPLNSGIIHWKVSAPLLLFAF